MIIRCTKKLLKLLAEAPDHDVEGDRTEPGIFEEWYGNLLYIDRRKCLFFTEARTLFSVFAPDVLKRDLVEFERFFWWHVREALRSHGLDPTPLQGVVSNVVFRRTRDRRLISSQNELAFHCRVQIEQWGGLNRTDFARLHRRVNDVPMSLIEGKGPADLVRSLLQTGSGRTH